MVLFFKDFGFFWDSGVPAPRTESWLVCTVVVIPFPLHWFKTEQVMWFWLVKCELKSLQVASGKVIFVPDEGLREKGFVVWNMMSDVATAVLQL